MGGNDELILKDALGLTDEVVEETPEEVENTEVTEEIEEVTEEQTEVGDEPTEKVDEGTSSEDKATEEETEDVENSENEESEEEKKEEKTEEPETISEDLTAFLKELDPEAEVKTQSEAITLIKERYSEIKEVADTYEKNNKQLIDVFESNPEVGDFMKAIISGMDPVAAAGIYISETLAPEEGEKGSEEYKAALEKKQEEKVKREKALKEFESNHKSSQKLAEDFVTENKLDKAEFQNSITEFDKQIAELRNGVITKALLNIVMKAGNYDKAMKDVEKRIKDAEEKAYLRGKNEKIVLKKTAKENTDGMPGLTSSPGKEKESSKSDFWDLLSKRR